MVLKCNRLECLICLGKNRRPESGFTIPLTLPHSSSSTSPSSTSGTSNSIQVRRLKNKIGTHIVPTAELALNGTTTNLIDPLNQGVKNITPVLNITRVYFPLSSVGHLRRCIAIANAYAEVRSVGGGDKH